MTFAFRDSASATNGATAANALGIVVPPAAVAGDYAILIVSGEETAPSPTWGSSFGGITTTGSTRANASIVASGKTLTSGDLGSTVTTTFTTSKARCAVMIVLQGVPSGAVLDVAIGDNWTGGTTGTALGVTTTQPHDGIVVAYSTQSNTAVAYAVPAGFTAGPTALSTVAGMSLGAFYLLDQAAAGATGNITTTYAASENGVSVTIALLENPAAPPDANSIGVLGDSLTYQNGGTGIAALEGLLVPTPGWPGTILVNAIIGRFVYNAGDSGGGTPGALDAWAALPYNPRDLVVALGTNDVLSALSSTWLGALNNLRAKVASDLPGTHRIWWVNVVADPTGGQGMNGAIGTKGNTVAAYNAFLLANLNGTTEKILDWNAYAVANVTSATYWQNDANHVHMTDLGYGVRNAWITSQLDPFAPNQLAATVAGSMKTTVTSPNSQSAVLALAAQQTGSNA